MLSARCRPPRLCDSEEDRQREGRASEYKRQENHHLRVRYLLLTLRLHATSEPFFNQIVKRKPTSDPHPPPGTGKDKILITEALGLVMIDYGDAVVGGFGEWSSNMLAEETTDT